MLNCEKGYKITDGVLTEVEAQAVEDGVLTLPHTVCEVRMGLKIGGLTGLRKLVLPGTLREIPYDLCCGATELCEVVIGEGVEVLSLNAFENCCALKSVTLPDSLKTIESEAFAGCAALEQITLREHVEQLGSEVFHGAGIRRLALPSSVKELHASLFSDVTDVVLHPDGDFEQRDGFIWNKRTATLVFSFGLHECMTLPAFIRRVGHSAFAADHRLRSLIVPKTVTELDIYAFCGCSALDFVEIEADLQEIPMSAFEGCGALTEVNISGKVQSIGQEAFDSCIELKKVTLPSSLRYLGTSAFSGCQSLEKLLLPDSIEEIPEMLCYECRSLTAVRLPRRLKSIFYGAFLCCDALTAIKIPSSVTEIVADAFDEDIKFIHVAKHSRGHFALMESGQDYEAQGTAILCFPEVQEPYEYALEQTQHFLKIGCWWRAYLHASAALLFEKTDATSTYRKVMAEYICEGWEKIVRPLAQLYEEMSVIAGVEQLAHRQKLCAQRAVDLWGKLYEDRKDERYKEKRSEAVARAMAPPPAELRPDDELHSYAQRLVRLDQYDALVNDEDEVLLIIPAYKSDSLRRPDHPVLYLECDRRNGLLLKHDDNVLFCSDLHPEVYEALKKNKSVLVRELGEEGMEYLARVVLTDGVDELFEQIGI